jgi:hypothetical protein
MRALETLSTGLQRAPDWTVSIFKIFLPKQHLHESRSGLLVRGYNSSCRKSQAQLDSQGKLTTPRRENRKIQHENEILKTNEHASYV